MIFTPTPIEGVLTVGLDPHRDDRGFFARAYCEAEFAAAGAPLRARQINLSRNDKAATLRGMHFQSRGEETKLVQCVRGRAWDVALDLRPGSPTYLKWFGAELSPEGLNALYLPVGVAHGFITLTDETDLLYVMGEAYAGRGEGVRWNDPAFAIAWPREPLVVSAQDAAYPDFQPADEAS
jgi:dTDP-4-dehydrorhamnose 3,5-epimerase